MDRQHGRQLGINTAALDMGLALTRGQAISKVLTAVGTFAARRLSPNVVGGQYGFVLERITMLELRLLPAAKVGWLEVPKPQPPEAVNP